ncbi:MAG: EAL domain-containing protein, partial [Treponema sp.]|nr:EAL domain-containing protein [Treponema sp.]
YTILSIIYSFIFNKKLTQKAFVSILSFNIVLLIGYIIRIIFPNYLIMNFFTLIAVIIIYLSFENPTLYIEEKSGLFNIKALSCVINELKTNKYQLIMGFTIHNYNDLREIYSNKQTDKGLSLIGTFLLQSFPKYLIFYLHDGRFVIIGKNFSDLDKVLQKISSRFESAWNTGEDIDMFFDVSFTHLNPDVISNNRDLMYSTLISSLNEIKTLDQVNILIDNEHIKKIELNKQIKQAVEISIEDNSVELFLQPLVDTKNHKLIGAEALARIRDKNGNIISPVQFIPIAEKNGRINLLGEQMFEKTCKFIHDNDIEALGLSWINVNLSPIQFLRPDLNSRFTNILKKYNVPASKIHLEITEESMIDYNLLQKQIQTMKKSGFQFVLDDYGSGYSNVSRLKKCPFINIKLDMELVWDYFKSKDKILPTLVNTFKQMEFTVTAEGIESLEMATAMKEIGCDYLQGFCFSKPVSSEEFIALYSTKKD